MLKIFKKKSNCCNVKIEEVKPKEEQKESSCCSNNIKKTGRLASR